MITEVMSAKDPFTIVAGGVFPAKAPLQLELIVMQAASDVKQMFRSVGYEQFFVFNLT